MDPNRIRRYAQEIADSLDLTALRESGDNLDLARRQLANDLWGHGLNPLLRRAWIGAVYRVGHVRYPPCPPLPAIATFKCVTDRDHL